MPSLRRLFFIWLANLVPNLYCLKILKAGMLTAAGVKLKKVHDLYFLSPLQMDRPEKISMGAGVFINRGCVFEGLGRIEIGNNVQIGPNVILATTNHKPGDMDEVPGNIRILDNVWIGANAVVVQGVTLGPNVIVGAGSVVTRSFDNCTIVGVPASPVRKK